MSRNQRVGQWGEQAAADYLSAKGYEIMARNVRTPYGEIDLIAQKDGFTIFVEVKARTSVRLVRRRSPSRQENSNTCYPVLNITPSKMRLTIGRLM